MRELKATNIVGNKYSKYGESVLVNGQGYSVDYTAYGETWCKKHDMKPEFIAVYNDRRFVIWANIEKNLGCAFPAA